jgi:hypothetical protein
MVARCYTPVIFPLPARAARCAIELMRHSSNKSSWNFTHELVHLELDGEERC